MSKYTKPIPLDKLPETPAVYGEMLAEYNETKRTVSRDIEVEGLGKGRLVLSKQNKGKPFFYADEANIEANQKAAKQLQTAETIANAPLLLAPFFSIAKGGQRIIKQRRDNQIKKSVLGAQDLDKVNNVIDLVKSKASGTTKPVIPSKTTAPPTSIMNAYKNTGITPQQKKILSNIVLQQGTNNIESYGFGPEGPRGGATDAEIMQAYRERTGELDLDPARRIAGQPIPNVLGFAKKANDFNDYVEKAYQYRLNRLQERKTNLMKGFDEVIQNDSGQDVILVKTRKLKNRQDPAAKENYVPRLKYDVEQDIVERLGYEMKQNPDIKFLQLIRRELNKIEQQNPQLYLTNLMEYGDAAYLEHKVARRRARKFWSRVEGQRAEDKANGLFQWTGAASRNTLENLRLLFDPNYKTLKDVLEDRLIKLEKPLGLKSNGDPEGFVITIEDPNEAVFSAKDLFVRSNPGNIQIRKAGTGEVVGIIPDFYRQIYSTQFADAFNKFKLALTGTDVPDNLKAQGQETIDVYRKNVLDKMLKNILTGKVSMLGREQAFLDELAEFYNFFTKLEESTGVQWVRKPNWVDEILTGKNNFADPAEADIQDFNIRDQAGNVIELDVDTLNALRNLKELEDLLRNIPREQTGRLKGNILTSKRKFARELRKDIDAIRRKYNLGEYQFKQGELNI